jgi:hypothetical protein
MSGPPRVVTAEATEAKAIAAVTIVDRHMLPLTVTMRRLKGWIKIETLRC